MSDNVYDRAANILREKGWCRERLRMPDGRLCLYGAMVEASGGWIVGDRECIPHTMDWKSSPHYREHEIEWEENKALLEQVCGASIEFWNDVRADNKEHVIDVLEQASAQYEQYMPETDKQTP